MRKGIILTCIVFFTLALQAQNKNDGQEEIQNKIETMKVAFLSSKLELGTKEAQSFWPIYNEFQAEFENENNRNKFDLQNISDEEAKLLMSETFEKEERKLEMKRKYADRMVAAIGYKKTLRFFHLEQEFKKLILKNYKERLNNREKGFRNRMGN